jgi:TolB-like protein/class 3 adenylate cyclase
MERKLAAILSGDVAGFSRLTAIDEEATLATLAIYLEAIGGFVREHAGRIFGNAGDGFVAEFASAVQATRCAVAIQRSLARRNADLPADRRLEFRIGVNLGDVVVSGDDLLGDAVNVAARLQEIASPSGICLSGSIREHVAGKVSFHMTSLGERSLKNMPRPVPVFKVDWRAGDPAESGILSGELVLPDKPSIAVLPFVNMSDDPGQDYFADGISEDIITALSRHRWFFVIARNSTFAYKGKSADVKQVARELGVRYVLEGSVRKAGDRVRITGQLIDAETCVHLWAEHYDRALDNIFDIQDEITESVVGAIEPEILVTEGRRAITRTRTNPDAYECSIRGIWYHYQSTREDLVEAEKWLRRAIDIDPRYARGPMALARVLLGRCLFGWSADVDADRVELLALAESAVALDERDPYCHYAMFAGLMLNLRPGAALAAAQRAIDLNPNFALGFVALGWGRISLGHFDQALEPLLRASRLSPNDPLNFWFFSRIALAHFHLGNFAEGLHFIERAMAKRRLHMTMVIALACLAMLDRLDEIPPLLREIEANNPTNPEGYWRAIFHYADPAHRKLFFDALAKGGLPVGRDSK